MACLTGSHGQVAAGCSSLAYSVCLVHLVGTALQELWQAWIIMMLLQATLRACVVI